MAIITCVKCGESMSLETMNIDPLAEPDIFWVSCKCSKQTGIIFKGYDNNTE